MNIREFMENTGLSDEQAIKILARSKQIISKKVLRDDLSPEVIQQIIADNKAIK